MLFRSFSVICGTVALLFCVLPTYYTNAQTTRLMNARLTTISKPIYGCLFYRSKCRCHFSYCSCRNSRQLSSLCDRSSCYQCPLSKSQIFSSCYLYPNQMSTTFSSFLYMPQSIIVINCLMYFICLEASELVFRFAFNLSPVCRQLYGKV